ncbi:MAG: D-alanyl-D-alanine carboxypeptidase [Eubacterium sp.]|nr:D-alanyl-D-alanine carboxypeptidase [Eubacterium sp.]
MMKRLIAGASALVCTLGFMAGSFSPAALAAMPEISSQEGMIVKEINSGDVLAEQNASEKYYPASTTKLMTALVMMDYAGSDLSEKVTVGTEIETIGYESSVAHLEQGEIYSYEQLLYALLLPSGNDAANVIATAVGRKIAGNEGLTYSEAIRLFVDQMNQKAADMGLENTHFVNAHGLHDDDHYTTPADLLKIAEAAFGNETIAKVEGTKIYEMTTNTGEKQKWKNTDLLLYANATEYGSPIVESTESTESTENADATTDGTADETAEAQGTEDTADQTQTNMENPYYNPKATGGKTGNTDEAGRCFVFSAQDGNAKIIGVLLKGDENGVFGQASDIINEVFDNYRLLDWTTGDGHYKDFVMTNTHYKDGHNLSVKTDGAYSSMIAKGTEDQYSARIVWDSGLIQEAEDSLKLVGSVDAGTQVAQLEVYKDGTLEKSTPVYAENQLRTKNIIDYLRIAAFIVVPLLIILVVVIRQMNKRKRRILRERQQAARRRAQQRMYQAGGASSSAPRRKTTVSQPNRRAQTKKKSAGGQPRSAAPKRPAERNAVGKTASKRRPSAEGQRPKKR